MMRRFLPNVCLFTALLTSFVPTGSLTSSAWVQDTASLVTLNTVDTAFATETRGGLPLMFIENVGQFDEGARFQVRGAAGHTVWLAEDAIWLTVLEPAERADSRQPFDPERLDLQALNEPRRGANIKLSFVGANPNPVLEPFEPLDTVVSYFIGNDPEQWRPDVPVWGGVRYVDLYPSIDLEVTGEGGELVPRLAAQAGADLSMVRLRVEGANTVTVEGDTLRLSIAAGEATWPLLQVAGMTSNAAVQQRQGALTFDVAAPFTTAGSDEQPAIAQAQTPGDKPADLLYGTFLGGSDHEVGFDLALDSSGAAYVTGCTSSSGFPTTPGAFDTTHNGEKDAFVTKLNMAGTDLVYATFLGGSGYDIGMGIAVDEDGNAYVNGETDSSDFVAAHGPGYDTTFNGAFDGFVVKLSTSGSSIEYATYLGGSTDDYGRGIALDSSGNAYVTGWTYSSDFPAMHGPGYDTSYNGWIDSFVVKLDDTGTTLVYATFLGGAELYDVGYGIAVDGSDNAYIAGGTYSADFPAMHGPGYDTTFNGGGSDGYVVKLSASGLAIEYATFLGGSLLDRAFDIAVDAIGRAYVAGDTSSLDFPAMHGPGYDTSLDGESDAFVVKLSTSGTAVEYASFLGGSSDEAIWGVAVDETGRAYVAGYTDSIDLPVEDAPGYDVSFNGGAWDGFIAMLDASGTNLGYATFFGGSLDDRIWGVAVDDVGRAHVTGITYSVNFPAVNGPGYDTGHNGDADAFAAKLVVGKPLKLKLLFVPLSWQGTQEAFSAEVDAQAGVFLNDIPLNACRDRILIEKLDVTIQNFDAFTCSLADCAVGSIKTFVQDELGIDPTDYDIVAGLVESSPCPPVVGCSNRTDTIWGTAGYEVVTAHEIGHIYGLVDQYCSNQAGSEDPRCNDGDIQGDGAATGDVNWLDANMPFDCPPDGSNDSGGSACCDYGQDCSDVDYPGVCCLGNKNAAGGRSTMSFADAPGPRGFDGHDVAHLSSIPELNCDAMVDTKGLTTDGFVQDTSATILDVNLRVHPDDSAEEQSVRITPGEPTSSSVLQYQTGDYALQVVDDTGKVLWSQTFAVFFDYDGPVLLGVDYSGVSYDAVDVSYRIPYDFRMRTLNLYHGENLIFSKQLPATDVHRIYLPVILRGY